MNMNMNKRDLIAVALFAGVLLISSLRAEQPAARMNPFFAMDTSYRRNDLTHARQLALVKELGFAGVSEDVQPPAQMKANLTDIEANGLKLFAIYASASATPAGDVIIPNDLPQVLDVLKGHDTIIWLHIGGKDPAFDSLERQ